MKCTKQKMPKNASRKINKKKYKSRNYKKRNYTKNKTYRKGGFNFYNPILASAAFRYRNNQPNINTQRTTSFGAVSGSKLPLFKTSNYSGPPKYPGTFTTRVDFSEPNNNNNNNNFNEDEHFRKITKDIFSDPIGRLKDISDKQDAWEEMMNSKHLLTP